MTLFLDSVWQVLLDLAPWLLLGALVAGVLHVLLPKDFLRRQFSGPFGIFKAVGLGVPLPLCSCAVIPVGLSLKQSGASSGATVAFLISTPQTGVDSILVSASFLGWPFAIFKVVSAAVMGIFGGWWTDRPNSSQQGKTSLPIINTDTSSSSELINRWTALLAHSVELLRSIWRWLLFGVFVSAAITSFVPTGMLSEFGGGSPFAAMLVTLVIALPLYVCATASVPIAAALVASGLPVGAALVFLMAGPATNVATIGAVYRTLGRRALVVYLSTVIVGSIVCGWLFGFLIEANTVITAHTHDTSNWWSTASAVLLLAMICWFALQEAKRFVSRPDDQPDSKTSSCCETTSSCCE